MLFNEVFRACVAHDGIVAVASCSKDGQAHVANTWNKYLILTEDENPTRSSRSPSGATRCRARWAWEQDSCCAGKPNS